MAYAGGFVSGIFGGQHSRKVESPGAAWVVWAVMGMVGE